MRLLRSCVYWLLLFSLFGISSCTNKLNNVLTNCPASTKICTVTIDPSKASCVKAGQDQQDVPLGYTVIWAQPTTDPTHYSAEFWLLKTPFHSPNSSGPAKASVPAGQGINATGDTECNTSASTGCYFPYFIYKDGQKCGDPGIHIVN